MGGAIPLPFLYVILARTGEILHTQTLKFVFQFCIMFARKYFFCPVTIHRPTLKTASQTPESLRIKFPLFNASHKFFGQTQLIHAYFCTLEIRYSSKSSCSLLASTRSTFNRQPNALDIVRHTL